MDGDPVSGEPSQNIDTKKSLTEVLIELCPSYMAMGMTYEQFWHCNTKVHKAYREAWNIKRKNDEWARWRQGCYYFTALMCAAPVMKPFVKDAKPGKYPDEPWPITQKEADEQQAERERAGYEKALAQRRAEIEEAKRRRELDEEAGLHADD